MRYQYWIDGQMRFGEMRVEFVDHVDVVVAGLGTAGAISACCAAGYGLTVLGLERSTGMGGQGGMSGVVDYYYGTRGGIAEAINRRCQQMISSGAYTPSRLPEALEESLPPAVKSYCLEEEARKQGVRLWYDAQILGVFLEGNQVVGVRCAKGDEICQVGCRVLIDATGEAEVAHMAGCRMQPMRAADGSGLIFSKVHAVLCKERWIRGGWQLCGRTNSGCAADFTRAILDAATMPSELRKEDDDGRVVFEGVMLGMREGRRIVAEETLSFEAFAAGAHTEYPLYYSASLVDNINRDMALEDDAQQDFQLIATMSRSRVTVGIPMGALLPVDMEGMLVAGRCMGVDHDFSTGVRMKRDIEKSGEAAATWAVLAIRNNVSLRDVAYADLAEMLRKTGCLDDRQDMPWDDAKVLRETGRHVRISFPETEEEIRRALDSEEPGPALWAIRSMGTPALSMLRPWATSQQEPLASNSALAAGMLNGEFALPKLRCMSRDFRQHPKAEMWSVHYPDAMKAIMLLGRMADAESVPWLMRILEDERVLEGVKIRQDTYAPEPGDYYTNLFLHSLCAIRRIIAAHPQLRTECVERISRRVFARDFALYHSFGRLNLTQTARELALSM